MTKTKRHYELQQIEDGNASNEIDQAYFWKIVSKKKKTQSRIHPIKLENGTLLTDPVEIRNAGKEYFENIHTYIQFVWQVRCFSYMIKLQKHN